MRIAMYQFVSPSSSRRSRLLVCLITLSACGLLQSAYGICNPSVTAGATPDRTISGSWPPGRLYIAVPVTTSSTGCAQVPTLTGGSVHVDLMYNSNAVYHGDQNIPPGASSQTQPITVTVPITPPPPAGSANMIVQVRLSIIAYFSNGMTRTYTSPTSMTSKNVVALKGKLPKEYRHAPASK